jgi:hypothetical protein
MKRYRILLREYHNSPDSFNFDCKASSHDHAIKQAEAEYPNCVILCCFLGEP